MSKKNDYGQNDHLLHESLTFLLCLQVAAVCSHHSLNISVLLARLLAESDSHSPLISNHHADASENELIMLCQETLSAIKFGRSFIS